jgi:hypothetical protein
MELRGVREELLESFEERDVEGDGDPILNRFAQVSVDEGDGKIYFS